MKLHFTQWSACVSSSLDCRQLSLCINKLAQSTIIHISSKVTVGSAVINWEGESCPCILDRSPASSQDTFAMNWVRKHQSVAYSLLQTCTWKPPIKFDYYHSIRDGKINERETTLKQNIASSQFIYILFTSALLTFQTVTCWQTFFFFFFFHSCPVLLLGQWLTGFRNFSGWGKGSWRLNPRNFPTWGKSFTMIKSKKLLPICAKCKPREKNRSSWIWPTFLYILLLLCSNAGMVVSNLEVDVLDELGSEWF